MIRLADKTLCTGCHACLSACTRQCICMEEDLEGFLHPVVDEKRCVQCKACEKACPVINPVTAVNCGIAYAARTKNEEIRSHSSSGGIFSEIAGYVVGSGGVVFGAAFGDDFHVKHIGVENAAELYRLRGSKYVQSEIGHSYQQTEDCLRRGQLVYFTGTPCQIAGLFSYLGKPYDNLITQDIICHGVPSPLVWKKYISYLESQTGEKLKSFSFRDKTNGWRNYGILLNFERTHRIQSSRENMFMRSFLNDLCLRPSCYQCLYKKKERFSDFTLADFWGIERILPVMDDNRGTSLLIVNSERGKLLLDQVKERIELQSVDFEDAIRFNSAMTSSAAKPQKRDAFMERIVQEDFLSAARHYLRPSLVERTKRILKRILKRE